MPRTFRFSSWVSLTLIIAYAVYFLRFLRLASWQDDSLGLDDWDQHTFYLEAVVRSLRGLEIPFWNPYYKGGMPIFENPQIRIFTPTVWLGVLFGSLQGLKLSIPLYYLAGCLGSWYLFDRTLQAHPLVTAFCSVTFVFSGFMAQHMFAGHANYMSVQLFPAIYACFHRFKTAGRAGFALAFSIFFAWVLWDGFVYGFLFLIFLYSVLGVLHFIQSPDLITLRKLSLLAILTLGFSAIRLIPAASFYVEQGAYFMPSGEILGPWQILQTFLSHSQHPVLARNFSPQAHNWWEYGNYVGFAPIVGLLLLLPFARRKDIPIAAATFLCLLLMAGEFHPFAPASLLAQIPGFGGMRCHARWGIVVLFCGVVLLASLVERARESIQWSARLALLFNGLLLVVFVYVAYDLRINRKPLNSVFETGVHARNLVFRKEKGIETVKTLPGYGAASSQYQAMLNHLSMREGYEMLSWPTRVSSIGEPGYRGEFYLMQMGRPVVPVSWSMNRLAFEVELDAPDILVVNQNFYRGWKASGDFTAESVDGLLGVRLKSGKNLLVLSYSSPFAVAGIAVTLVTLFGAIFLLWIRPRDPQFKSSQ
ncbi:MAG: hypothetical protein JNM27_07770 [Leptospirales bacterium]|nr:hypothetical protein [Leptospirales bacterium]